MKVQTKFEASAQAEGRAEPELGSRQDHRRGSQLGGFAKLVLILFAVLAVGIVLFAAFSNAFGDMLPFDYAGF